MTLVRCTQAHLWKKEINTEKMWLTKGLYVLRGLA